MSVEARRPPVTRDPARTRAQILAAARRAFAAQGLGGARVDAIAEASGANKRMIYYYFSDKEGLFRAVLESIYEELCTSAATLDLDAPPDVALARYVDFVWEYYSTRPEVIAILNSENLHGGRHMRGSDLIRALERPFVGQLDGMLARGVAAGVFRPGIDAMTLHVSVVGLVYFFLGNGTTLSIFFGRDLRGPAAREAWRKHVRSVTSAMLAPGGENDETSDAG